MSASLRLWLLLLPAKAPGKPSLTGARFEGEADLTARPTVVTDDAGAGRTRPAEAPVCPHARFPSDWHVFVVEPLELPAEPGRFLFEPPGQVLMTGDCLSRWPTYGSILEQPD